MKIGLTRAQQLFLRGFNPLFGSVLGWRQDSINTEFVRTYGIRGLLRFLKSIVEVLKFLTEQYGESEAHHLVGFAGMMNGCRWCGIGHNLSANILIFREGGVLFPIDELEIPHLQKQSDAEILALFTQRLKDPRWSELLRLIQRMHELRLGQARTDSDDDLHLGMTIDLWEWTNECTIETGFDIEATSVPVLAEFNRDRDLYRAYRAARDTAARE